MSNDIFNLFDGSFNAGGAASIQQQNNQSFSDITSENDLLNTISSGTDSVELLIDYSDFANFVTFNSAESYCTITADQILNDYPADGTADDLQKFINSLDGYQKYYLRNWPSRTGYLRLTQASASYVKILDAGSQDGSSKTSFVSPGTGSLSINAWVDVPVLTGTDDVSVVFQKLKENTNDGITVYCSSSFLYFTVVSSSLNAAVSASITSNPFFFSAVVNRAGTTGTISLYSAASGTFPALADEVDAIFGARYDLASGSFFFGSGSVAGKNVIRFTGSIDDVSVWSDARNLQTLSGSFNRKIFSQESLAGAWRFNEAFDTTPASFASIVKDCSGHKLDGRIQNYYPEIRGSGSLAYDYPDPVLTLNDETVVQYVINSQISGALHDRSNQSLIFNLLPQSFVGDDQSGEVFKNFALIMARAFDKIKNYIDQFVHLKKVKYGDEYNQAPDELLEAIAKFSGFDLGPSFATADSLKYFVGRGIKNGTQSNASADKTLKQIKSEFWRRTLLNLMYLYKTKGTRESVDVLLRIYGVNSNFIRLKEYARKTENKLIVERVNSEKSVYSIKFTGGSSITMKGADTTASARLSSIDLSPSPASIYNI